MQPEFDKLNRQIPNLIRQNDNKTPKLYIQAIADLETLVGETVEKQKGAAKKMNAVNTRGLNAVRQKIRKNNKDYVSDIEAYRKDPEEFMKEEEVEEAVVKPKKQPKRSPLETAEAIAGADDDGFTMVGAGGKAMQYTPESILKHLRTIVESRGRKNTDRSEQVRVMEKLVEVATTDYQRIRVLMTLIATRFDTASVSGNQMSQEQWKLAQQEFAQLLTILEENPQIVIIEGAEEWEDDEKQPTLSDSEVFKVPGSVVSYAERLDDELTRSLQHIDPHTAEYVERLIDEGSLYTSIVRAMLYSEGLKKNAQLQPALPQDTLNRVIMRRLEHVYFKVSHSSPLRRHFIY